MATMIGLFSAIGEHVPIFRKDKLTEATAEGMINRYKLSIEMVLGSIPHCGSEFLFVYRKIQTF